MQPTQTQLRSSHHRRSAKQLELAQLNQSEIGRAVGKSSAHISMVFNGKRMPSLDVAAQIAQHIGCSIDDLYAAISQRQTQTQAA